MKTTGLWRTLDRFAVPATVMAEWRMVLDGDFADAEPFLRVTQELAEGYPCTHPSRCGCQHEVVVHAPDRIVAACRCEERECPSIPLEPTDLLIHGLNFKKLCGALARAFRFDPASASAEPFPAAPRAWPAGVFARTHSPVYFCAGPTNETLLLNIEGLITAQREPFILLVPTELHGSAAAQSLLQRQRCAFIPLARFLSFTGKGQFKAADSIQPVLDRFAAGLADAQTIKPVLENIHREIAAVRDDRRNLAAAKARLQQMHGEGLFAFARHIDREAREHFLAVMAGGDVAKAARDLDLKDSTLRSKLEKWPKRGKAYAALAEIIRWRKSIKGQAGMEFAKRVASGAERDVDFPALIRDVVEELEELDPENWEERCGNLASALRKAVS